MSEAADLPSAESQRGACLESTLASLIETAEKGEESATESLFTTLYSELHSLARRQLAHGGRGITLGVTTLLHEAYLDMAQRSGTEFPDRARFMGYAARVMRGLIIDYVRSRQAQKRGGYFELTSLASDLVEGSTDAHELTQISEALDRLAEVDPELAELVDMKFFCGFSFDEIAAMRQLSGRTVKRRWQKARAYLHRELSADIPA
jgi:RNA polymerase sigma factor (TIGR02999 family)